LCNGGFDGSLNIVIDPNFGLAPFVINVFNTTTNFNYRTQTTGLRAGNYTITVTDAKLCTAVTTTLISQPDQISFNIGKTNITCSDASSTAGTVFGTISVTGLAGGVAPYRYILTGNNGTSAQIHNAPSGADHTFTVVNFGI
jgi:hypothetical protein